MDSKDHLMQRESLKRSLPWTLTKRETAHNPYLASCDECSDAEGHGQGHDEKNHRPENQHEHSQREPVDAGQHILNVVSVCVRM